MEGDGDGSSRASRKRKKDRKDRKKKKKKHSKSKSKRDRSSSSESEEEWTVPALDLDVDGQYSHKDAVDLIKKNIGALVGRDPLLSDLPPTVTLEEVASLIALEKGQAMTVVVQRHDGVSLPVVVHQQSTVRDLKKAIEKATSLRLTRQENPSRSPNLNWKYVWRTYWLTFAGQKLQQDQRRLDDYQIGNRDCVSFIKRLKTK